jgi:hypothetical protein
VSAEYLIGHINDAALFQPRALDEIAEPASSWLDIHLLPSSTSSHSWSTAAPDAGHSVPHAHTDLMGV